MLDNIVPTAANQNREHTSKSHGSLDADIIIKNAPDPIFISDLEGKILSANDAIYELLGFRTDEVLEQSLSRFISAEETREFTAALREVIERGRRMMPGFGGTLEPKDVDAVLAYLHTL